MYLCAADASGMMVSLIQSNYMGFGSGVVVPGTGISLQNRGAGFSLERGHPNEIDGGKRPFHTIIPGFLTRDGAPLAAFGVMGGPIQPPGHVQTLVRLLCYGMNPQAALDAPRWKVNGGLAIDLEAAAAPELRGGLGCARPRTQVGAGLVHGLRRRSGHRAQRRRLCRGVGPTARRAGRRLLTRGFDRRGDNGPCDGVYSALFQPSAPQAAAPPAGRGVPLLEFVQRNDLVELEPASTGFSGRQRRSRLHRRETPAREVLVGLAFPRASTRAPDP